VSGEVPSAVDSYDCHGCGQPTSWSANRCDNCESITASELQEAPIGPHLLADNEVKGYFLLHRVIHRHAFYDHDCQTTSCKAMHLWNSAEMTELLADAYERGFRDGAADLAEVLS
jgi:hypothetical protein